MTRSPFAAAVTLAPTPHLLGAALAGLLCLAGCSNSEDPGAPGAAGDSSHAGSGEVGGSGSEGGTAAGGDSASAGSSTNGGDASAAGATAGGAGSGGGEPAAGGVPSAGGAGGSAGAGGATEEPPHITSSKDVGVMTEEQFKALCDERGGTVEVMPHCGGFATGPGFSYDNGTLLLSEHTCAGANTCGGWNCVVPEQ